MADRIKKDKTPSRLQPYLRDNMTDLERTRKQYVAKRNDMIQKSRKSLSIIENKAVSYIFSKVKPGDTPDTVYKFDCAEFYRLMRWDRDSYAYLRSLIYSIASQTWGIVDEDGTERIVHWFNTIHLKQDKDGKVVSESVLPNRYIEIKIHEDIMEYIFGLDEQQRTNGIYYTSYRLENISLMTHAYSQNLYELLKSYENIGRWKFEYGTGTENDIQMRLAQYEQQRDPEPERGRRVRRGPMKAVKLVPIIPASWSTFHYFERDVLKPGKEEINKYTDLEIDYKPSKTDIHGVRRRKFCAVTFYIKKKTEAQKLISEKVVDEAYQAFDDQQKFKQVSLDEFLAGMTQETKAVKEEQQREETIAASPYPTAAGLFYDSFSMSEIRHLVEESFKHIDVMYVDFSRRELWAIDYISHYYDKIRATASDTKTTAYRRLLDMLRHDYDNFASQIVEYDKPGARHIIYEQTAFTEEDLLANEPEPVDERENLSVEELDAEIAKLEALKRKKGMA